MLVSSLKYDRHVSLEVTDREDANAVDGFLYTLLLLIALSNHAISDGSPLFSTSFFMLNHPF